MTERLDNGEQMLRDTIKRVRVYAAVSDKVTVPSDTIKALAHLSEAALDMHQSQLKAEKYRAELKAWNRSIIDHIVQSIIIAVTALMFFSVVGTIATGG